MQDLEPANAAKQGCGWRFTGLSLLLAIVVFAGVAPTLSWLEFSSGSENLIVETVLEMRHGGPWLVPNLNGAPRTAKPPMVNWIIASLVRPETVAALSDPRKRDAAYRQLSWEMRWPGLAFASLALIAGGWLGRTILGSDAAGWTTACVMASSVLFLRFGRTLSTDVQLMLWVTTANALFAMALLQNRRWLGCIAGGFALGLALMSKGPVALAQTVAPIALFVIWRHYTRPNSATLPIDASTTPAKSALPSAQPTARSPRRAATSWLPPLAALIAVLLIALPWPILVLTRLSGQLEFWYREVAAGGNPDYRPDPPYMYLALIPLLIPWLCFFFLGLVLLYRDARHQHSERAMLALLFLFTPIVIMTCFKEKNDRYLLPTLAPAAVVCASGLLRRGTDVDPARRFVLNLTWGLLAALALGLPIAGRFMTRLNGSAWWSTHAAIALAFAGLAVVAIAWRTARQSTPGILAAALIVMIPAQALFTYGYSQSARGLSDGRPVADAVCSQLPPDAEVWSYLEPGRFSRVPIDTVIYLNRLVRSATQPTTIPTDPSRSRALLVHYRGTETAPAGIETWREIGSTDKNEGTWRAYAQKR